MAELRFFSPYADIHFTANRLPHWQQQGAVYFITFGLADAVPHHLRTQWESEREAWLRVHPQPWSGEVELEYQERFSGAIERWLDAGHGSCILRRARLCRNRGRSAAVLRWSKTPHGFLCSNAESCACRIRATPELAIGKASPELEKLYLTQNKLAGKSPGNSMATGLFRSAGARSKTFRELRSLYPEES